MRKTVNPYDYVGVDHNQMMENTYMVIDELVEKSENMSLLTIGSVIKNSTYNQMEKKQYDTSGAWQDSKYIIHNYGGSFSAYVEDNRSIFDSLEYNYLEHIGSLLDNCSTLAGFIDSLEVLEKVIVENVDSPNDAQKSLIACSIGYYSAVYWEEKKNRWETDLLSIWNGIPSNPPEPVNHIDCDIVEFVGMDIAGGVIGGGPQGALASSAGYALVCTFTTAVNYLF